MKSTKLVLIGVLFGMIFSQIGKDRDLQYQRFPDKRGLNVFETSKKTDVKFEGLKVIIGGASTLQLQAINHENGFSAGDPNELAELGHNFNLATSNLSLDAQLDDGLRMNLVVYLSSRHHTETYVKDGYFQIDRLDFIKPGLLSNLMDKLTIKVGHMEINYGDAHFRRSDNAQSMYNPFVGNLILDAFNTEVAGEFYYQNNGIIAMFGLSNSKLNQDVKSPDYHIAKMLKFGYDKQINKDLRFRLTGSYYGNDKMKSVYMYSGDRTGSRYYSVMDLKSATTDNFRSGRWNPGFRDELTAIQINPFVKYQGLELFGVYESAEGGSKTYSENRTWTQTAFDVVYRFGNDENLYAGFRYNSANGKLDDAAGTEVTINRTQIGFGFFMSKNVLTKLEYVNHDFKDFLATDLNYEGNFSGVMMEAAISF